jgi:hypothetical protein
MVEKTCKDNVCSVDGNTLNCDNGGGGGETLEACAMEKDADCEKCQVVCAADGSKGYYCNTKTGKMVEKTCKDNICSVDKNTLNCDNGGGSGETLEACAMEKDADCTKCQVVCTTDGSKGYYCNTKTGKMVEKNCKDNVCSVDGNTLNCESAGSGDLTACAMEKDADCSLCQAVCSTDGSKGYYCNTKTSKMVEKSCNNNVCSVDGNTLNCDDRDACTASSDKACIGACSDDKKTGYYWSQGLKTVDCPNADCTSVNGNVACGEQATCTADTYTPSCSGDKTYALYCSSKEIVKQYNCKEGTSCVIHTDGKCTVDSDNCKSGKYDTAKYPKGYFECAPTK